MTALELTVVLGVASAGAGFLGSLTGLGGGVVIVPLLTLGFGVDLRYAIGASLVSVIATSSAAGAAYVKDGYSNIRVGMLLEVGTTVGALVGALLATILPISITSVVFGVVLLVSAYLSFRKGGEEDPDTPPDALAARLHMDSSYPTPQGVRAYHVTRVPQGCAVMFVAGSVSGLLGIGSGALKVLALDQIMRLPFKVSTTTSNFMIGVTAAASAGFYLSRGYIDPALAMPVMLGVFVGATLGSRILAGVRTGMLRTLFIVVLVALGMQMIFHGLRGAF
jgi:uncharacterized membrane protein YfcA